MTKQIVVALVLIGILVALMVGNAACQPGPPSGQGSEVPACPAPLLAPPSAKIQQLSDDLRLLQLLNRMQFTPEQIQALLPAVEALQAKRIQFEQQVSAMDAQLEQALTDERQLLIADQPLTAELQKRVSDLQTQRAATQEDAQASLAQAAAGLRKLLTAPQLAIVTGSYEAQLQAREMLEWLRTLSDNDFSEEAKANAEGLASPEKGVDQVLLLNLFNTARKLSAADFAKSEEELSQRLAPVYGLSEAEANARIAGVFANAEMPTLLREKAAAGGQGAG